MPDVFTKAKRSEVMSRIRGRGNKDTEVALIKLLAHPINAYFTSCSAKIFSVKNS